MLDHYSQYTMPSAKERKEDLKKYVKDNNLTVSDQMIDEVVLETPQYSLSGYAMFGRQEEITKLKKMLK
jgi:hypothetical protein